MTGHQKAVWMTRATWGLAVVLLVVSGVVYRVLAPRWHGTGQRAIKLPVPLGQFPLTVGAWVGTELPIAATTQEYMRQNFADDYFSRMYSNQGAGTWVGLYVVYCSSRPAGILGHRPGVCYPATGWIADKTKVAEFTSVVGGKIPCLVQTFHKPLPNYEERVVLSFYVVNGQISTSERAFSGLGDRSPNVSGDPARYVAQVQISSVVEDPVVKAASAMADLILDYLPDKTGQQRAALASQAGGPAAAAK